MSHGKIPTPAIDETTPPFEVVQVLDGEPSADSRDGAAGEILRTLAKVNRVVLRENDRLTMLNALCRVLIEHRSYVCAWIGLIRPSSGEVFLAASSGLACDSFAKFPSDGSSKDGPQCAAAALKRGAPFLISGSEAEDPCPNCPTLQDYPDRTTLALPLVRGEKTYGIFVVHADRPGVFNRNEHAFLVDLGENIAYALEKLEADEQRRNHFEEVSLLNEITRVALESTTIGEGLPHLALQLQGALDADRCDLALWNPPRKEITSVVSTDQDASGGSLFSPRSEGVAAVLAANRPVPCDQRCMPISSPNPSGPFIMGLPLIAHGTPLGAAFVSFDDEQPFANCDFERARMIAGHVALAITHMTTVEANARRIEALLALHETSVDLAGHHDIKGLLRAIVVRAGRLVGTDMGGLYLTVPNGLQMVVARGLLEPFIDKILPLHEGASGLAVSNRKAILIDDYNNWEGKSPMYDRIRVGSVIAAPLLWKDTVLGAFHLEHPSPNVFGADDIEIVSLFAEQAAVAIANARLIYNTETSRKELELAYTATLEGWVRALDLRDQETEGHTQRVTDLTVELARRLEVPEDQLESIRRGALLHDIGKIGIPDAILRKPGPLTEGEWTIMRRHPQMTWDMLSPIEYLRSALAIPYGHHERWNGSGYPLGIKGRQIPLAARIFAVVDVYDALKSDRHYRKGWPEDQTLSYISERSGVSFDPEIVEAFLEMMSKPDTP